MTIRRTRDGARMLAGGAVLSEILSRPGATNTPLDVIAASARVLAPGPRLAVLGFAAGGVVAPLRALGVSGPVEAVDLSGSGEPIFRELAAGWAGTVRIRRAEASDWLRRGRKRFDLIVEDLSEIGPEGPTKPWVSVVALPGLIRRRLRSGGAAVTNVLPWPGVSWRGLLGNLAAPFPAARVITFEDYENRILLTGEKLPPARDLSRDLRSALRSIRSAQAAAIAVRTLRSP